MEDEKNWRGSQEEKFSKIQNSFKNSKFFQKFKILSKIQNFKSLSKFFQKFFLFFFFSLSKKKLWIFFFLFSPGVEESFFCTERDFILTDISLSLFFSMREQPLSLMGSKKIVFFFFRRRGEREERLYEGRGGRRRGSLSWLIIFCSSFFTPSLNNIFAPERFYFDW